MDTSFIGLYLYIRVDVCVHQCAPGHDLHRCCVHGLKTGRHCSFWMFVLQLEFLTTDVEILQSLKLVKESVMLQTADGRGCAWLRVALNLKILDKSLSLLINHPEEAKMPNFFELHALSRCHEGSNIWLSMIMALSGMNFNLNYDDPLLDHAGSSRFRSASEPVKVSSKINSRNFVSMEAAEKYSRDLEASSKAVSHLIIIPLNTHPHPHLHPKHLLFGLPILKSECRYVCNLCCVCDYDYILMLCCSELFYTPGSSSNL